jgi:hypothetical protein
MSQKALVYCHAKPGSEIWTNHWAKALLETFISRDAEVTTLDKYGPRYYASLHPQMVPKNAHRRPDIERDGFSTMFLSEYRDRFDVVVLPDCGGPVIEIDHPRYVGEMIARVLRVVKPGGKLVVAKVLDLIRDDVNRALVIDAMYSSPRDGSMVESHSIRNMPNIGEYRGDVLLITKRVSKGGGGSGSRSAALVTAATAVCITGALCSVIGL